MGKEISHIICAEQTFQALSGKAGGSFLSLLKDNLSAFHFGSIAADTFFYGIRLPLEPVRLPCCGDLVHGSFGADSGGPVYEMLKALRDSPGDPLFAGKAAFVSGFLTHIALDSILHPYVYHVSGNYYAECRTERQQARIRHRLIESWLDLHLLRQSSRDLAGFRRLADIRRNGALNGELLGFFFAACGKAFGIEPSRRKELFRGYRVQMLLNRAFTRASAAKLVRRLDRLFSGRLGTFAALFYPWEEREIPGEIIRFEAFLHPVTGERREGGLRGLWDKALERSEHFLLSQENFLFSRGDGAEFRNTVPGYNLSTGLVGGSIRDAVHYDCIPLERLRQD